MKDRLYDIFLADRYGDLSVPKLITVFAVGGMATWGAIIAYPQSLKDNTIERVNTELKSLNPDTYVEDGSAEFDRIRRGGGQSMTDGSATAVVDGKRCEIKFDTKPSGLYIYPEVGSAACTGLIPKPY